jgi:uncharacterized protein (UPF0548 family)
MRPFGTIRRGPGIAGDCHGAPADANTPVSCRCCHVTLATVAPGTVVVLVRHLGFWSLNGCRVVYAIAGDDSREFGFAYGTLTNHAEIGEEIFKVSLRPGTGEVSYVICAVSKPRSSLARLGYPVTRSLQARFRRDSAAAMVRA